MNLGIEKKVALVTGASRGIGRAIALELAREGVRVIGVSRSKKDLGSLMDELGGAESGHASIVYDLAADKAPVEVWRRAQRHAKQIDIVINNVGGTLDVTDPFCSQAEWRKVWRLNLEVAVDMNRLALPPMQKRKWGRVVNISSISGLENHGPIPYCSAKAALIAYTRSMGRLVSGDGVIMTTVLPGAVFTEDGYWDETLRNKPQHVKKYLAERMAIHRFGTLEEISAVVAFLCSRQASFCVGSVVPVDGGQGRGYFGL